MMPRAPIGLFPSRRQFLRTAAGAGLAAAAWPFVASPEAASAQSPPPPPEGVTVLAPQARIPVSLIIDDSTCLVNLNKFAIPQFAAAWGASGGTENGKPPRFDQPWRQWPVVRSRGARPWRRHRWGS